MANGTELLIIRNCGETSAFWNRTRVTKMKKILSLVKLSPFVVTGTALFCLAQQTFAQTPPPFDGTISFDGVATLDGPIGSATRFTSIFGISGSASHAQVIYEPTGNYVAISAGTPATFAPFTFGSAP